MRGMLNRTRRRLKRSRWYSWCRFFGAGSTAKTDVMDVSPRTLMSEELKELYLARALYDAVEDCNIQQVNTLLYVNKASPNILIPEEGMTPFHYAAGHENVAFGKVATALFVHNGGDPNVRCEGDRTVLHVGVAWNRVCVVESLIKSPFIVADPYLKDEDGLNSFNYAVKFLSWEALEILQLYGKRTNPTGNAGHRVKFLEEPKYYENDDSIESEEEDQLIHENSIESESEYDKSDKLHRSSGRFNSDESENSISVSQINNAFYESSSSDNSLDNILNKNITTEYCYSDDVGDLTSVNSVDESKLSLVELPDDFCEDLENIRFPYESFIDNELTDIETSTGNSSTQSEDDGCSINTSELLTDISGLSSYVCSDDYYTCPDTNSKISFKNKIDKQDKECVAGCSRNLPSQSTTDKLSTEAKDLEISELNLSSQDDSNPSEVAEEDYDTDYVRQSLRRFGCPPGPIIPSTKSIYVQKLNRIMKDDSRFKINDKNDKNVNIATSGLFSCQLKKVLFENAFDLWKETLNSWSYLERDIIVPKSGPSFTYLLLDPRVTKDLPARAAKMKNPLKVWQTFINSIFYVGKGSRSRPNDHMMEAFNSWIGDKNNTNKHISPKTEYIIDLWRVNTGVVCVQAFHHLTLQEAHIREAAMIDAIGLDRLTNEKRGTYYDKTLRWRYSDRCKLGCYLLHRAMHVFLADGERQLQPVDLT